MEETSVYKSKNQYILFYNDKQFIENVWHCKDNISEEEHRLEIANYFDKVVEYKPRRILVNMIEDKRSISVDTQTWIAIIHIPKYSNIGLNKLAILMSNNSAISISIIQTIEETDKQSTTWETKYFQEKNLALEWLNI